MMKLCRYSLLCMALMPILLSERTGAAENAAPPAATAPETPWLVPPDQVQAWLDQANRDYPTIPAYPDGHTWVVSPKGNDSAKGTEELPFATIGRALEMAKAGDRVLVKAGVYHDPIQILRSGEEGKPIILEGERGPDHAWLSFIDLGKPLAGWTPAPEIGPGVYKCAVAKDNEPHCLTVDGKQVLRINDRLMDLPWDPSDTTPIQYGKNLFADGVSGFRFLTMPADGKIDMIRTEGGGGSAVFWDGVEAVYGLHKGTVYLRFRNGEDPGTMSIRSASAGTALTIDNQSHIIVRNMAFRGAEYSVIIKGSKAAHNVIEGSSFHHGRDRITVTQQASYNVIRNNDVTLAYFGSNNFGINSAEGGEGEETDGNASAEKARSDTYLRTNIYRAFKHIQGTDASADIGIRMQTPGTGNRILGNHVYNGLKGLHCMGANDLVISGNVVHNMSSLCLVTLPGLKNARIHDNLFFDSNILLRIHQYNTPVKRSEYHYRNVYRLPENGGKFVYVHYNNEGRKFGPEDEPTIGIYHNTMIGGIRGLVCGSLRRGIGMSKTQVLNNIISTANEPVSYLFASTTRSVKSGFDGKIYQAFDYNWVGGSRRDGAGLPAWFGAHNINAAGQQLWPANYEGSLLPPAAVQGKGIDVSRPYVINGQTYEPLPGMEPGYFSGDAPAMGAYQLAPAREEPSPEPASQ